MIARLIIETVLFASAVVVWVAFILLFRAGGALAESPTEVRTLWYIVAFVYTLVVSHALTPDRRGRS